MKGRGVKVMHRPDGRKVERSPGGTRCFFQTCKWYLKQVSLVDEKKIEGGGGS